MQLLSICQPASQPASSDAPEPQLWSAGLSLFATNITALDQKLWSTCTARTSRNCATKLQHKIFCLSHCVTHCWQFRKWQKDFYQMIYFVCLSLVFPKSLFSFLDDVFFWNTASMSMFCYIYYQTTLYSKFNYEHQGFLFVTFYLLFSVSCEYRTFFLSFDQSGTWKPQPVWLNCCTVQRGPVSD